MQVGIKVQSPDFGKNLIELHILKSSLLQKQQGTYPIKGTDTIERREFDRKNNRIYINDSQYFGNIPKEVWEFEIGGYQVLDRFLGYRKKRKLSLNEIETYCKIVSSIKHTIKIMEKIDKLYDQVEKDLIEYAELNQNHKLSDFEN